MANLHREKKYFDGGNPHILTRHSVMWLVEACLHVHVGLKLKGVGQNCQSLILFPLLCPNFLYSLDCK
jgi:hypothetical protein